MGRYEQLKSKIIKKLWYSPGEIRFSKEQLRDFLLPNYEYLKQGLYPTQESCYGRAEFGSISIKTEAHFCEAIRIVAEIDARIASTPDGEILLDRYTYHLSYQSLSRKHRIDELYLDGFISWRLSYIAGWRRKMTTFQRWQQNAIAKRHERADKLLTSQNKNTFKIADKEL